MTHTFDKAYWEKHWGSAEGGGMPPHPALDTEIGSLSPGSALDAGSGEGAEALWLAARGWDVTAVDISAEALRRAASRAPADVRSVRWIEADLTHWEPETTYNLVTTFYAHPTIPQVEFYRRLSRWVTPGGTLLIVGHAHGAPHGGHGHHPAHATASPESVRAMLDDTEWDLPTAEIRERHVRGIALNDIVIRAHRLP